MQGSEIMHISEIPTEELEYDLAGAKADKSACAAALSLGIMEDRNGKSIIQRRDNNRWVIDKIEAELKRRANKDKETI